MNIARIRTLTYIVLLLPVMFYLSTSTYAAKTDGAKTDVFSATKANAKSAQLTSSSISLIVKYKSPITLTKISDRFENKTYSQLAAKTIPASLTQAHKLYGVKSISQVFPYRPKAPFNQTYLIIFQSGTTTTVAKTLRSYQDVVYADPIASLAFTSYNDPLLSSEWHLYNPPSRKDIAGLELIDLSAYGAEKMKTPVIAIIDRDIYREHPDLQTHLWTNTNENLDGVDNDSNGYVDDVWGCHFGYNSDLTGIKPTCGMSTGTATADSHGTSVAGVVAADNNNGIGVRGICDVCKVMRAGIVTTDLSASAALFYAIENGADVINMSFSISPNYSNLLREMIAYAAQRDIVLVASAGNSTSEAYAVAYPASDPNVIAVSGVNTSGSRSHSATIGPEVALTAPSENIMTTFYEYGNGLSYVGFIGTSAAAPQVSGAAGLIRAYNPNLTRTQIRELLLSTTDPNTYTTLAQQGAMGTGRLNAFRALYKAANFDGVYSRNSITSVQCYDNKTRLEIRSTGTPAKMNGVEATLITSNVYSSWVNNGTRVTVTTGGASTTFDVPQNCVVAHPSIGDDF